MEQSTRRCGHYGHPEFVLTCADELGSQLPWLCGVLEGMVASGHVFTPGELFQLGWSPLMVRNAAGGRLSLWELDLSGVPGQLECSVTRSLAFLIRQKAVLESFGMADQIHFPSLRQTAVRCTRFDKASKRFLTRSAGSAEDSGWFFGCRDGDHDHQPLENLAGGSLYEMACANPVVIDFLAMPVSSMVLLDHQGYLEKAFSPAGAKLSIEPGSYLDFKQRNHGPA